MGFAYMPLYTGDYLRDTLHLSCSEHGIYLRLLMHCWDQKGPVPLDERRVCGIVNARSGDEIEALRRVLTEFFTQCDDGWYNQRIQKEIEKSEALSEKRRAAGYKRQGMDYKGQISNCSAQGTIPIPILSTKELQKSNVGLSPDVTQPDQWDFKTAPTVGQEARYVLAFLNKVAEKRFQAVPATMKLIQARLKDASVPDIKRLIAKQWQEWNGTEFEKYLRPATLFNATKFANYLGALE